MSTSAKNYDQIGESNCFYVTAKLNSAIEALAKLGYTIRNIVPVGYGNAYIIVDPSHPAGVDEKK